MNVSRSTSAFTLFEVAISLLLLSVAVTSVMVVFPTGLKAQQLARFHIYAAMKAEEMVETFASAPNDNTNIDVEAFNPWDVPSSYHTLTPDLEARVSSNHYGIMPVPLSIARRLDSNNDEIMRVLNEGGYIYYSQAQGNGQLQEQQILNTLDAPPSETQKLVFAVTGYAQQNAMYTFPWKSWPYYTQYPSPPMHGAFMPSPNQYVPTNWSYFLFPENDWDHCYEGSVPFIGTNSGIDGDIRVVWDYTDGTGTRFGFKPYAYDSEPAVPSLGGATRYIQSALWYCLKKGLPASYYDPADGAAPLTDFSGSGVPDWQQVEAMRFLAHSASCLTKFKTLAQLGGQPSVSAPPASGFLIPTVTLLGVTVPDVVITHDKIVFYHETCMNLVMRYCAYNPYDWGAPRPTQRAIMTDYPLVQYDLFTPPLSGLIFSVEDVPYGAPQGWVPAAQWKPVPGSPITNIGCSYTFPDRVVGPAKYDAPNGATIWGDSSRFTLANSFDPSERCREIVFWSVDWMSYVDAETAPSAPVDSSEFNIASELKNVSYWDRLYWTNWEDMHLRDFRNPERYFTFTADISGRKSGASIKDVLMGNFSEADKWDRYLFSGLYGADRNYNGRLDRGPVPTSVRLRAVEVARFNYYDPRVPAPIR